MNGVKLFRFGAKVEFLEKKDQLSESPLILKKKPVLWDKSIQ